MTDGCGDWLPNEVPRSMEIFFNHVSRMRQHYDKQFLDNVKFFTTAFFSVSTVSIAVIALSATLLSSFTFPDTWKLISIVVMVFPILALAVTWVGKKTIRVTYRREMEAISTIAKMEKALGLHEEIREGNRLFKNDGYFVPNRFVMDPSKFDSTDEFVDYLLEESIEDSYWVRTEHLFDIFYLASLFLISVAIVMISLWFIV